MVEVAHLEKMGRELKCPICLGLLKSTVSLSCNHTFCFLCISKSMKSGSSCPVCKVPYTRREMRPAPHMDSLVEIYKSMELASGINLFSSQTLPPIEKQGIEDKNHFDMANKPPGAKQNNRGLPKLRMTEGTLEAHDAGPDSHKIIRPSFINKKRVQVSPYPRRRISESPMASDSILKLESNGSGDDKRLPFHGKSSMDRESVSKLGHDGHQLSVSRGMHGIDEDANVMLSPFFWLREQDNDDDEKQRDQQLEADHVSDTPPYAMPEFSDLKDSEDGSPEKAEADSSSKLLNLYDSETFEWTQRPCSPELFSMSAGMQGMERSSSAEKEQSGSLMLATGLTAAPDGVRNQSGKEYNVTERGIINLKFVQSGNSLDSGSELLKRSQKSCTRKSKRCHVTGHTQETKIKRTGNDNTSETVSGNHKTSTTEKEGNEHLVRCEYFQETIANQEFKGHVSMQGNFIGLDHLEDAHETMDPKKKLSKRFQKPSKKNSQTYTIEQCKRKRRAHGSSGANSDEQLQVVRSGAKVSYDPSRVLDEVVVGTRDQISKGENNRVDKSLPAVDVTSPGRSQINGFKRKRSDSNMKCRVKKNGKKNSISRIQKTCIDSFWEDNPALSPTGELCASSYHITELPSNVKNQSAEDTNMIHTEKGDEECPQAKRCALQYSRPKTRIGIGNSRCIKNQVNRVEEKDKKGAVVGIACSGIEPALKEIVVSSYHVSKGEPKISGDEKSLKDGAADGPPKTVEVIAQKDLSLRHESKSLICCIFCHSLDDSEACGPMLHFANGRTVASDDKGGHTVIHAHRNCAEWAPDVYFEDETIINLEKEVSRSRRIKCTSCGIKGAALGCYEKSCRKSYHVPCAKSIAECRWDMENFVMLCPLHSSAQLPKQQFLAQKKRIRKTPHTKGMQFQPKNMNPWRWVSGTPQKWVLCCSALGESEKELVSKFSRAAGLPVSRTWCASVTHVVASTDENGACRRTLKFLMGILEGKWILNINWVKACLGIMEPVDEEPYEIIHDIHGCSNGPRRGRMRVMREAPKLFNGFKFYFSGDFGASYKGYLRDLIVAAGGMVLQRKPIASASRQTFILYNVELPEKCKPSVASLSTVEGRRKEAETQARTSGAQAVCHSWVLASIAACSLQPVA